MTTLFLDRKEKAGVNSVYSRTLVRTIAIKSPCVFAILLPAQRQANGCASYSIHCTEASTAKYAEKLERAKIPFIIIDESANIYTATINKKPTKRERSKLTLIDGTWYGLESIGERLADVTIDKFR